MIWVDGTVVYYSRKIITAKTQYNTYDGEPLAIVEVYKTGWHYLKDCKRKVLVLINHNNFCRFMDIKNLSSRQIR